MQKSWLDDSAKISLENKSQQKTARNFFAKIVEMFKTEWDRTTSRKAEWEISINLNPY